MFLKVIVLVGLLSASLADIGLVKDFTYDDLQEVLRTPELLDAYNKCAVFEGPCGHFGTLFRDALGKAVETACEACNPHEKMIVKLSIGNAYKNTPDVFEKLMARHDKDGKYREAFVKFLLAED